MQRRKASNAPSSSSSSTAALSTPSQSSKIHHESLRRSLTAKRLRYQYILISAILVSVTWFSKQLFDKKSLKATTSESSPSDDHGHSHASSPLGIERLPPQVVSKDSSGNGSSSDASSAMAGVSSTWVDGEKKLKRRLLKLMARQQKGKDLGVDHLTRWMGDGVPAWTAKDPLDDDEFATTTKDDASPFPSPIPPGVEIVLKPYWGSHRPDSDAVFSFAQDYPLDTYLSFIQSLKSTNYDGDIVLALSQNADKEVLDYLRTVDNLIVYVVTWSCVDGKGQPSKDSREGMNKCKMADFYSQDDSRDFRPVATARYELYYAWVLQYHKQSRIFLADFRDMYFQGHPFDSLDKGDVDHGTLYLFGENSEVTNLGKSTYNKNWLQTAYGSSSNNNFKDVNQFFEKTIICSGTTMGNTQGIKTYLEAMVHQYDLTKCLLKGCDQGFHNYLYYSDTLKPHIGTIQVFDQGKGNVNNLGALRDKPLAEWGLWDDEKKVVLNWDKTVTKVAHQVDRDAQVNKFVKQKKREFKKLWNEHKSSVKMMAAMT